MAGRTVETERVCARMVRQGFAADYAWYLRHCAALRRGDPRGAVAALDRAIALAPQNEEYRQARQRLAAPP
jgi:hypothetical protein